MINDVNERIKEIIKEKFIPYSKDKNECLYLLKHKNTIGILINMKEIITKEAKIDFDVFVSRLEKQMIDLNYNTWDLDLLFNRFNGVDFMQYWGAIYLDNFNDSDSYTVDLNFKVSQEFEEVRDEIERISDELREEEFLREAKEVVEVEEKQKIKGYITKIYLTFTVPDIFIRYLDDMEEEFRKKGYSDHMHAILENMKYDLNDERIGNNFYIKVSKDEEYDEMGNKNYLYDVYMFIFTPIDNNSIVKEILEAFEFLIDRYISFSEDIFNVRFKLERRMKEAVEKYLY